ncbi:hypothetical protein EDC32_10313 [Laceyella sacchari]|nr:hypothetical protein EDC32_10313 [Laceyella sacchari]
MQSERWKKLQCLLARWPIADRRPLWVEGAQDSTGLDETNDLWVKEKAAGSL